MKTFLIQLYRFAVVVTIAWLIRDVAVRQRVQGDSPVLASEIVSLLPEAFKLRPDDSARDGLFVLDRAGRELGYVVRTQPACRDIIGYAGTTDAIVVLDRDWKILGLKIHASEDTASYLNDITLDRRFLKKWNGLTWDVAAGLDLKAAGIEGVSGSTMTSMAIAQSVKARLQLGRDQLAARVPLRFAARDLALLGVLAAAGLMAFGRTEWRQRWKRPYQIALLVYVGFIAGDLIAQKLLVGWARGGVPWTSAPGLLLLTAAALLVPWASGKPFYCHHICPHGAAQELISQIRPKRFQVTLPADVIRSAGVATLAVAGIGLVAAFFVPQAYCRFGCPTGALLNFVRTRGATDSFSRRDTVALGLVLLAFALNQNQLALLRWIQGVP